MFVTFKCFDNTSTNIILPGGGFAFSRCNEQKKI